MTRSLLTTALAVFVLASAAGFAAEAPVFAPAPDESRPADATPGLALDDVHTVGAPIVAENLQVFPIYASVEEALGEIVTLDEALAAKTAEVREVGATTAPAPPARQAPPTDVDRTLDRRVQVAPRIPNVPSQRADLDIQQVQQVGAGATVNTLVIENKGDRAILVLAGTVVKGGRQDRQIGQDFVVGPGQTVPVDAFCVEHGRWTGSREGLATGDKFESTGVLALRKVRTAGQYEKAQGKVWEKVAEVNAQAGKAADTGTLMATLDDGALQARRVALTGTLEAALDAVPEGARVVGLAYAVDGEVRVVRWFFANGLYRRFRPTLLATAAVEALTARSGGEPAAAKAARAEDVQAFVTAFRTAAVSERRETASLNANEYSETATAYKSECVLKGAAKRAPVTVDFSSK